MKEFGVSVFLGICSLIAVEWNVEQIPGLADHNRGYPLLTLDNEGDPCVLYVDGEKGVPWSYLKFAANTSGTWNTQDVANPPYYPEEDGYGIEIDRHGNIYVIYCDSVEWQDDAHVYDLFLAIDSGAGFTSVNVTQDIVNSQEYPVIQLDEEGNAHFAYLQHTYSSGEWGVFYGWLDEEGFHSEQVATNIRQGYFSGMDFVLDETGIPHVFYVGYEPGYEDHLWYATRTADEVWTLEKINARETVYPSAAIDGKGKLYVAYDGVDYDEVYKGCVFYLTNQSGEWEEELVFGDTGSISWYSYYPSIVLDADDIPHIAWVFTDYDEWLHIYYSTKSFGVWRSEPIINTPDLDQYPGYGDFFAIDDQGYAHLTYATWDWDLEDGKVYYAKSKTPVGVEEFDEEFETPQLTLDIRGSTIRLTLSEPSRVRLALYDVTGRMVKVLACGFRTVGSYSIPLDDDVFSSGVYFVRAQAEGQAASAKLVLVR